MQIRTRFAPSPTGHLHIGSARTALYAWLFAKHHRGTFILRIEDTDLERSTPESVTAILEGMDWLKLDYQEGPFYQTHRFDRYQAAADYLLKKEKAYRCYCSKERLETLRAEQLANKEKPRYDGRCRYLNHSENLNQPFVIRFCNPTQGEVAFEDQVYGSLCFQNAELDDLIIVRSDGTPTYNFTVVVDDWDMQITHVIRGDDHINNTPRQINLLHALGAHIPIYAHLPMILGADGKRLSKRHGAVSLMEYQEAGFLPEALLNYLVRLGWSHGDQEIFSREELIDLFTLANINRSPAALNPEKLLWLNQHYLKTLDPALVAEALAWHMQKQGIEITAGPPLIDLIAAQSERCKTLVEMVDKSRFFYTHAVDYEFNTAQKHLTIAILPVFQYLLDRLQVLTVWEPSELHGCIHEAAQTLDLTLGKIAQPLRVALTGGTVSPPIDTTLYLLGKQKVVTRIVNAMQWIHSH